MERSASDRNESKKWIQALAYVLLSLLASASFSALFISKPTVYQEFHKSVISLAAIFLAFSPAFYALLYSNDKTRILMVKHRLKNSFDRRFRNSILSGFLLMIFSLLGVVSSYTFEDLSSSSSKAINTVIFSMSIATIAATVFWTLLYARITTEIINHLLNDVNTP